MDYISFLFSTTVHDLPLWYLLLIVALVLILVYLLIVLYVDWLDFKDWVNRTKDKSKELNDAPL